MRKENGCMKRILVCEDEDTIREFVVINLQRSGYSVVDVNCGEEALRVYDEQNGDFDVALLDVTMPGMDGFTLCKKLRERSETLGIIFLTARSQEIDRVGGLMMGADDYVTKPFTMSVLYAKTMALIKRSRGTMRTGDRLESGGVVLDLSAQRVWTGKQEVALTPKEYALLRCLMQNKNIVMSREQLLVKCWGYDYEGEARAVDTHIKRLREKLGEYAGSIKTVIKAGYRWEG